MPPSEQVRRQAWLGLVQTDREARYLTLFSDKMQRRSRVSSWIVAVGSTAALSSFVITVSRLVVDEPLNSVTAAIGSSVTFLVVAVSFWAVISDFSKKAVIAATISDKCRDLALRWRQLWAEIDELDDGEALNRTQNLERLSCEATKDVPYSLGIDQGLNEKCEEQTYALIKQEYPEAA